MSGPSDGVAPVIGPELEHATDGGSCPHLAVLLRTPAELPSVLAAFYGLGARRGGWLVHRSLPGEGAADSRMLADAGLDVAGLEGEARLEVAEFDPDERPEESTQRWTAGLEAALRRGLTGLWYSRFAVGQATADFALVEAHERAWDAAFAGRPVVTLCPYVVGDLDAAAALERLDAVASFHAAVAVPRGDGFSLLGRATF